MEIIKVLLDVGSEISYRKDSKTDLAVITEVFFNHSFSLDFLKKYSSIKNYYQNIIEQNCTPLIIDAGANIGAASISFLNAFQQSKLLAIEPEVGNVAMLNLNLEAQNASVLAGAIASESGMLFLHDPGSGDWGFRVSGDDSEHAVKAYSINDLLKDSVGEHEMPFICKIDIEGGEKDLFSKNIEWIFKFPIIMIEIHDWMLPGQSISRNLFAIIGNGNFDVVLRRELLVILNNDLLK